MRVESDTSLIVKISNLLTKSSIYRRR